MSIFTPSSYFKEMLQGTKEVLRGDDGRGLQVFFWLIIWLIPFMIVGWYIGDMITKGLD